MQDYMELYNSNSPLLSPIIPRETTWDFEPIKIVKPEKVYMSDPYGDGIKYKPN